MNCQLGKIHYLKEKTRLVDDGSGDIDFWKNSTLPPEKIPECSICVKDTLLYKTLVEQNKNVQYIVYGMTGFYTREN